MTTKQSGYKQYYLNYFVIPFLITVIVSFFYGIFFTIGTAFRLEKMGSGTSMFSIVIVGIAVIRESIPIIVGLAIIFSSFFTKPITLSFWHYFIYLVYFLLMNFVGFIVCLGGGIMISKLRFELDFAASLEQLAVYLGFSDVLFGLFKSNVFAIIFLITIYYKTNSTKNLHPLLLRFIYLFIIIAVDFIINYIGINYIPYFTS